MLREFYDSLRENREGTFIKLLSGLTDYTAYHFATEEKYMKEFGFADTEAHVREHRLFVEKVREVQERVAAGKLVVTFEMTNFLRDWVYNHILGTDMRYSQCFIEHGLS
jgi:hemerythrin